MRDGTLERIFRKWSVWNDDQPKLYAQLLAGEPVAGRSIGPRHVDQRRDASQWEAARRYLPSLLRASVVTIVLSCLSMALAVDARRADRDRPRLRRPPAARSR